MTVDPTKDNPIRLTAFDGRSFLEKDKSVWYELRDIFDSLVLCGTVLVFSVAMFVIPGIIFIPLGLATFVKPVGSIMSFLFWPMLAPIITLSLYTSYTGVFEARMMVRHE